MQCPVQVYNLELAIALSRSLARDAAAQSNAQGVPTGHIDELMQSHAYVTPHPKAGVPGAEGGAEECSICQEELRVGEMVRRLPCRCNGCNGCNRCNVRERWLFDCRGASASATPACYHATTSPPAMATFSRTGSIGNFISFGLRCCFAHCYPTLVCGRHFC